MNTILDTRNDTASRDDFASAERSLTEAGIAFTVVHGCPHPTCEVCLPADVPVAA